MTDVLIFAAEAELVAVEVPGDVLIFEEPVDRSTQDVPGTDDFLIFEAPTAVTEAELPSDLLIIEESVATEVETLDNSEVLVLTTFGGPGNTGPIGPEGPAGPEGPLGTVWRGDWDWQTDYVIGDAVSYGGVSWVAYVDPPVGETPPQHQNHWQLIADKGQPGEPGPPGPPGHDGLGAVFSYQMPVAQTTALVDHTLGRDPITVQVLDELGIPCAEYEVVFTVPSAQIRVAFDIPVAATIRLT